MAHPSGLSCVYVKSDHGDSGQLCEQAEVVHQSRTHEIGLRVVSRAVAQFGSASGWGSEGRRFNSCQPDKRNGLRNRHNPSEHKRCDCEVPQHNSDCRDAQWCPIFPSSDRERPVVNRVKPGGGFA